MEAGSDEQAVTPFFNEMTKVWNDMRNNNELIDIYLISSDGVVYPAHRTVLAGYSRFFRALFTNPMNSDNSKTVHLQNVGSDELGAMLRFIYNQELVIDNDTVNNILHASDYLSILDVHKACVDYLQASINPKNCLSIRQFASDHFLDTLEKDAQMYLLRNFTLVAEQSMEILSLPVDELVPLLSSDMLNVRNEEIVWTLVLRWVGHDVNNRLPHLMSLLKCIRLGLLDVQYFLEHVKNHPYVKGNVKCRPVIIETLKVLLNVETITQQDRVMETPECARPRIPHEVMFAIGGWSGGSPTSAVETYDTRADRWIRVMEVDPAGPRSYHGTVAIDFDIYVIGGFDGMDNFNTCRCFNAVTKTWTEIAPMHEKRCYVSVVVLDKTIYAMGGYNGHHRLNTAEKYDRKTNQWTMIPPMNVQRSDSCATVLHGKIYITGGFDGRQCLNSAEVFDPATNEWSELPNMRTRRSGVSCIAYHDYVYVLGGFNGSARMSSGEKFSPVTNQWTPIPDMYTTRSNFAIEVIDDMVFAIGGFNGVATIHQVECFDDRVDEWFEATDMNVFRSALTACVVPNLPNLQDYIHQNRHMLMEEKRQKLMANHTNANEAMSVNNAVAHITQAMEEVNSAADEASDEEMMDAGDDDMVVEDQ